MACPTSRKHIRNRAGCEYELGSPSRMRSAIFGKKMLYALFILSKVDNAIGRHSERERKTSPKSFQLGRGLSAACGAVADRVRFTPQGLCPGDANAQRKFN